MSRVHGDQKPLIAQQYTRLAALTGKYQVWLAGRHDLAFIVRAQRASQHELDQLDPDEIAFGLASGQLQALILNGKGATMCVAFQTERHRALLTCFYREGPVYSLWEQTNILWEKLTDVLRANGVTEVAAYVHRDNPRRDKLIRMYRRLGFEPDTVRISRRI